MNKILVTGGSGFIGTNLIEALVLDGYVVLNIDVKEPPQKKFSKYWEKVDINSFDALKNAIDVFNPNYIIHLAARTDLNGLELKDYDLNILGVENILKIANKLNSLKKIIITSSMLVCHGGYYPKNQFDFKPTTIYGESKVITEKIVWENKPSCDWAIIRPTSIWGPWFGIPYRHFFDMIISKKYFHIGNKGCTKTYGYVGNAVYQIKQILFSETKNESKKVFYIGDDPAINIEEWANEISAELGNKIFKMPYFLIKCAALFGDFLKLFNFGFPLNSFRLNNMTTDNVLDLTNTYEIAPNLPYTRKHGIENTLKWLSEVEKK
ncbi:NAD-dependent epimerase/dehydratase family protein [Flavobacterium limi]|uniref:NDP-sugar dehydratase or epimerase n=1 Tax=Flavobacterium limi TaxID=2045105 RepID=A0ABQ1U0K0_9FLAO|nr:NAD(P)-dependent oxidoreductase [Flavobacterium limi]GGF08211.1 NDP-sugar dehydratase or epimerase [Flavobacterium limi]